MDYLQSFQANSHEVAKLVEYDLKCFDLPMGFDEWDEIVKRQNPGVSKGDTYNGEGNTYGPDKPDNKRTITRIICDSFTPVAWWSAAYTTPAYARGELVKKGVVKVMRMAVLPKHRGKGYSYNLISDLRSWLRRDFVRPNDYEAQLVVPEYLLQPEWSNFIGGWLVKHGFQVSQKGMLKQCRHSVYGRNFEHFVQFDFPMLPGVSCL